MDTFIGRTSKTESSFARLVRLLEGFGGVLMAILFETAGSRYFAEMATSYGVDMESLLREDAPMDKDAKAALIKQFETAARKAGEEVWLRVLGLQQQGGAQAD